VQHPDLVAASPGSSSLVEGVACRDAAQHDAGAPRDLGPASRGASSRGASRASRDVSAEDTTPSYSFVHILQDGHKSPRKAAAASVSESWRGSSAHKPLPDVKFQTGKVYVVVPGVLGFACFKDKKQGLAAMRQHPKHHFFTSDLHAEYDPLGADFGPVDLGVVYKFCALVADMLDKNTGSKVHIYYFGDEQAHFVNSFLLLGCCAMVNFAVPAQDAYGTFRRLKPCPFPAYRDSGPVGKKSTFDVTLQDCLYGFAIAQAKGWLSPSAGVQLGDYVSWKHEDLGEFHHVCPRLVSFKGPTVVRKMICPGLFTCTPLDYVDVFLANGVSCVVRINSPDNYNTRLLEHAQIRVYSLQVEAEDMPSEEFVADLMQILREEEGKVVIHSKHGIQTTGLLLCMHLLAEDGFTATQSIGWMRMVHPGCIVGPQQHALYDLWQTAHEFEQLHLLKHGMQQTLQIGAVRSRCCACTFLARADAKRQFSAEHTELMKLV